jgi:hypothetical protein
MLTVCQVERCCVVDKAAMMRLGVKRTVAAVNTSVCQAYLQLTKAVKSKLVGCVCSLDRLGVSDCGTVTYR